MIKVDVIIKGDNNFITEEIFFSCSTRTKYDQALKNLAVHILQHHILSTDVQDYPCIFFL
jgi:hypothetical protein